MYLQNVCQRYKKHVTFLPQINFLEGYWKKLKEIEIDRWLVIYLIAIFIFRFLLFDDCFYSTISILHLGENRIVTGLGVILLLFFGYILSNFSKDTIKLLQTIIILGNFSSRSIYDLFALTILTDIICNLSILSFEVVLIRKNFVM